MNPSRKLFSHEESHSDCVEQDKKPFIQTKIFLAVVLISAILMLTFKNYAHFFYPSKNQKEVIVINALDIQTVLFDIKGMTCNGCASHVENDVNKLLGIVSVIRHEEAMAQVDFNQIKVSLAQIKEAINDTGYKIRAIKKIQIWKPV